MLPKLLAIETSSEACSVALSYENKVDAIYEHAPRLHGELLLPMVGKLLKNNALHLKDLEAIAVSIGPGSFTGLRIGLSVAKALAFSVNLPVIGISSLATLALRLFKESEYTKAVVALDARQGEVYWGAFSREKDHVVANQPESVESPEQVVIPESFDKGAWVAGGIGWSVYAKTLSQRFSLPSGQILPFHWPRAEEVLLLALKEYEIGNYTTAESLLPVYLRNKVTG